MPTSTRTPAWAEAAGQAIIRARAIRTRAFLPDIAGLHLCVLGQRSLRLMNVFRRPGCAPHLPIPERECAGATLRVAALLSACPAFVAASFLTCRFFPAS